MGRVKSQQSRLDQAASVGQQTLPHTSGGSYVNIEGDHIFMSLYIVFQDNLIDIFTR